MALQHLVPAATVTVLAAEGHDVDTSLPPEIDETVTASWK